MRLKIFSVVTTVLIITLQAAICVGAQDDSAATAFYPQTRYEFSPVLDGAKVVHDFVIQNKGTATLKVERVKTG